jgi:hypothetical protein
MSSADAAMLLADQSFNFAVHGEGALRTIAGVARRAPAFTLVFDDLEPAVAAVQSLLDGAGHHPVGPPAAADRAPCDLPLAVEHFGDEAVIWDGAREALHHLSASAGAIWRAAREGAAPSEIVDDVVAATGRTRADVEREVDDCLADLSARDLLA